MNQSAQRSLQKTVENEIPRGNTQLSVSIAINQSQKGTVSGKEPGDDSAEHSNKPVVTLEQNSIGLVKSSSAAGPPVKAENAENLEKMAMML